MALVKYTVALVVSGGAIYVGTVQVQDPAAALIALGGAGVGVANAWFFYR